MSQVCARCGAVEWEGQNHMELRMPDFTVFHDQRIEWVDHVMQRMTAKDMSSESVLLAYYLALNGCYHFEPAHQGMLALKAKRSSKEIGAWGLGSVSLTKAAKEMFDQGVVEYFMRAGEISHVSFSDEFLEPEIKDLRSERRRRARDVELSAD